MPIAEIKQSLDRNPNELPLYVSSKSVAACTSKKPSRHTPSTRAPMYGSGLVPACVTGNWPTTLSPRTCALADSSVSCNNDAFFRRT